MVIAVNYGTKFVPAEHLQCLRVGRRESLPCCERRQHLRHRSSSRTVARWAQKPLRLRISYSTNLRRSNTGSTRNRHRWKNSCLAGSCAHHPDHFEAHAADLDGLTHCGPAAEKLLLQCPPMKQTRRRSSSSPALIQRPSEGTSLRISPYSGHTPRIAAVPTIRSHADAGPPDSFEANVLHQGSSCLDHVDVSLLKHNFLARTLTTRLLTGLLRPADNDAFAEGVEPAHQNAAEAAAVGDQQT